MSANKQKQTRVQLIIARIDAEKIRYLLAGGWNTFFGYASGLFLYDTLGGRLHVVIVGIIANILAISMAFVTYKLFVFCAKGNWLVEYFRTYLVYGATAILGIGILWILVDGMGTPFWIAQGLAIFITVIVSYISHSRFTFRRRL